jgi:hypothetical protein
MVSEVGKVKEVYEVGEVKVGGVNDELDEAVDVM